MQSRRLRRLRLGLQTLLGPRPMGFFIPYRHAAAVAPTGYPALEPAFDNARSRAEELLGAIRRLEPALLAMGGPPPAPRFTQSWFPRLDGAAAYAIVRTRRPARIVEVGSGHSTRFMARAISDGGLATRLTCIDPAPRATFEGLDIVWRRELLASAADADLAALGPGDVLFIDSSHILMPGTDVDLVLNHVLPRLPTGVLLHVHDVFLPDPYPTAWAWRGYNEQCGIAALLTSGAFRILFASHALTSRAPDLVEAAVGSLPLATGAHESSLWLEKAR